MSTVCIKLKMTVRRCIWGNTLTSEAVVVVPGNHIKAYKLIGVGGRVGEGQACRGWRGGSIQLWQILVKGSWRSSNSLSYQTVRKGPVGQHSTCSMVQEWTDRQLQQGYSSLHMNNLSSNHYCWMSGNWHSVRLPDFHLPQVFAEFVSSSCSYSYTDLDCGLCRWLDDWQDWHKMLWWCKVFWSFLPCSELNDRSLVYVSESR